MSRYAKILGSDHRDSAPKNEVTKIEDKVKKVNVNKLDNNKYKPIFLDPRLDLEEDSILWTILLELAYGIDPDLYGALHGMRCQGTILKKSRRWGYIMQPIIDPDGCIGWVSRREYDEEKLKWLDPFREDVIGLLGKI